MYAFDYQRPANLADARAAFQGDARFLAGGQSLIQAMRLRLSQSERLVDLGAVAALADEGAQPLSGWASSWARAARASSRVFGWTSSKAYIGRPSQLAAWIAAQTRAGDTGMSM